MQQDTHVQQDTLCSRTCVLRSRTRYAAGLVLHSRIHVLRSRTHTVQQDTRITQQDTRVMHGMQCYTRTQAAQAGTAEHFGP